MIDIVLLRIMKDRKEYKKLIHSIPAGSLDAKTQALLADFGKYFDKFKEHKAIDLQVFLPRFKGWHPDMDEEVFNTYVGVLRNAQEEVDEATKSGILTELYEADAAMKVANVCSEYNAGDLAVPIADKIGSIMDEYKININAKSSKWDDTDIDELLKEDLNNEGIKWRMNTLNECMRPLRGGDFGIIAARPDKGKTTFLASEVTFMASQLPPDKNIIWLNNEGKSSPIIKRLWQSALGVTISELVKLNQEGKLKDMYRDVVGRLDRIRVFNIHGRNTSQVETIIEQSNPGIILYDMIDNINGFGSAARTDLQLEQMYQWARERSVKYDAIGLATSQISNDGCGQQFPTLGMLKDSKTGKQGACDFQLMIGASDAPDLAYSRYLGLPKNKLRRDGAPGDPRGEVQFKPSLARYEDII